jgi:peptide subunit release factor 1 (eRF1)
MRVEANVENEVHWGAPDLAQLLWLVDEHKPYGIVVITRKHAQFFLYRLGEMLELEDKKFSLQPSKEKEMGPQSRAFGVRMSRGTNRDVYEHHLDAEYSRYYRRIAESLERWCDVQNFQAMFLIGLNEVVKAIHKDLSQAVRERTILVEEELGWLSRNELHQHINPIVALHKREHEMALVEALLGDEGGLVLGIDETLVRLQQGKIRNLAIIKGLDASLKRCGECLWVDRTADPVCPACGRDRHTVNLHDILPELVRQYKATLEVVSGEAAQKLQKVGGIGAWLREFEKREYSASA